MYLIFLPCRSCHRFWSGVPNTMGGGQPDLIIITAAVVILSAATMRSVHNI